jgi:CubicO group peptidase (beta-lactamase class C family)
LFVHPAQLRDYSSQLVRLSVGFLICVLWVWPASAQANPAEQERTIDQLMSALHERGQFNGTVLVAVQGKVIYRNAFGPANFQTNAKLTPDTPFCLASVTKPFTATAIMMLAERNKLSYDDALSKYIPEFARSSQTSKITIRQLLTHTSGIPDYGDLDIDDSNLTQKELVADLLKRESVFGQPGQRYRYSNPGYALLAIVMQRVSGQRFGDFVEQMIFKPLGMGGSFVYDSPQKKNSLAAIGYSQFGARDDVNSTAVPGDGGIYSTVDDLFKWDQALYTDKLVRQSSLAAAFAPGSVQEGASTYGFGWNVADMNGEKYVWHTGSTAGFRAFIERRLTSRITVILLTNRGNSKRIEINDAILNILRGRSYVLPKMSGAEKLYKTTRESGAQAAVQMYGSLAKSADYDLSESELNTLGYQLLYGDKRVSDAVEIFKLNATEHPASSNAFDSLGEAYRQEGDKDLAIKSYENAIRLDPANGHAVAMLKELK